MLVIKVLKYMKLLKNLILVGLSWDELDELDVFLNSISNFDLNEIHKKGKNARIIAETKFSKEVILKKYLNILK